MSPDAAMAVRLNRIASLTSIRRTRADDDFRREEHGGSPAELRARVLDVVAQLERVAAELEASLS